MSQKRKEQQIRKNNKKQGKITGKLEVMGKATKGKTNQDFLIT